MQIRGRLFYTSTLLLLTSLTVRAQLPSYGWALSLGTINSVTGVVDGPDGRILVQGKFNGTKDLDLGPGEQVVASPNGDGAFISALQADGTMDWAFAVPGNDLMYPGQILVNSDGSLLVNGSFKGIADFDPSSGVFELDAGNDWDAYMAKYTADGGLVWAWMLGNSGNDFAGSMSLAADGTIRMVQNLRGDVDVDPGPNTTMYAADPDGELALLSFAQDGSFLGVARIGTLTLRGFVEMPNGELMVAGSFYGSVELGAAPHAVTLDGDPTVLNMCFMRFNSAGDLLEASLFENMGWSTFSVKFEPDGSVVIVGSFEGTVDLDPGPDGALFTSNGGTDNFAVKWDPDGNYVWGGTWGSIYPDSPRSSIIDPYGDIYIMGFLGGDMDVDPGPGTVLLTNNGSANSYLLKLAGTDGSFVYGFPLGAGTTYYLDCKRMHLTHSGSIIMSGDFRGFCDMDPGPGEDVLTTQENPGEEVYLSKLDQDIGLSVVSASREEVALFPQPCTDELHVVHRAMKGNYAIVDMEGRVLRTGQLQSLEQVIPTAELRSGVYLLRVVGPSGPWSKRFVKVR